MKPTMRRCKSTDRCCTRKEENVRIYSARTLDGGDLHHNSQRVHSDGDGDDRLVEALGLPLLPEENIHRSREEDSEEP